MIDYKEKMYEIHSTVSDILYDAERGKVSWKEAVEQVQTEAKHLLEGRKQMIKVEIYWQDLTEQKQAELLELFGDNGNWDMIPMCTLEIEEEE